MCTHLHCRTQFPSQPDTCLFCWCMSGKHCLADRARARDRSRRKAGEISAAAGADTLAVVSVSPRSFPGSASSKNAIAASLRPWWVPLILILLFRLGVKHREAKRLPIPRPKASDGPLYSMARPLPGRPEWGWPGAKAGPGWTGLHLLFFGQS